VADNSFESLVQELIENDLNNDYRRPAAEGVLESLLRKLLAHGFDNDDLREIVRARPHDARLILEQLNGYAPTLAPLFTPSQLVRIAKSGQLVSAYMDAYHLVRQGHSTSDLVTVVERNSRNWDMDLGNLYIFTRDLEPCSYDPAVLVKIGLTRGISTLSLLAHIGPQLQRAGYAPDKLAELLMTGGKSWEVYEALRALDALRRDEVSLLDCFEHNELAEIAIKGGPDTLNALRELWKDLAHLDPATGKHVPSFLSTKELYDLACVRDGGEGLRNAARAHGVSARPESTDDEPDVEEWNEVLE
jgi:hypothetical protein